MLFINFDILLHSRYKEYSPFKKTGDIMIPAVLHKKKRLRAYTPKNAVLRLSERSSKRDVKLFTVTCLDLDKQRREAWKTRIEIRKEPPLHRLFVYGPRSGGIPKGQFKRVSIAIATKLAIEVTSELYNCKEITSKHEQRKVFLLERQNFETGRLTGFQFVVDHISSRNLEKRGVEVEFRQVNNAIIPTGEYEHMMQFLERSTGFIRANKFPQQSFNFL